MMIAGFEIPLGEMGFDFVRSPGAGGQNVNKVNSKAVMKWHIESSESIPAAVKERFLIKWSRRINQHGFLVLSSSRYRDQLKNKNDCYDKLAELLEEVKKTPIVRKKTKPSKGQKERRLREKKHRSETKARRQKV